jgi:hypothetical protein
MLGPRGLNRGMSRNAHGFGPSRNTRPTGILECSIPMTILRRLLVLCGLMFWIGGFTFYSSVVVPIGTDVLGGPAEQGEITRRVTIWLNVSTAVALLLLAWDLAAERARSRWHQLLRWLLWAALVAMLLLLIWWHPRMNAILDLEDYRRHRGEFRRLHRLYLWTSTVQWGVALVLFASTLWTWRANDRAGRMSHEGQK